MNRRRFLWLGAAAVAVTAAYGTSGQREPGFARLLADLQQLQGAALSATGEWSVSQIFLHCRQSVLGSMQGYPQHKPAWFVQTIGKAAFYSFQTVGFMQHNLAEPIAGLAPLPEVPAAQALAGLIEALQDFAAFNAPLAPHFVYGKLSARQYAVAHVLHIRNHLSQIRFS